MDGKEDLDSFIKDAIFNGSSWTTGVTQEFWKLIEMADVRNMALHNQRTIVFLRDMEGAMSMTLISHAVLVIVLLTIAIPYNTMTAVVICKDSKFWTQINAILALNSALQALTSIPFVFFNAGGHLLGAIPTYSEDVQKIIMQLSRWVVMTSIECSLMW